MQNRDRSPTHPPAQGSAGEVFERLLKEISTGQVAAGERLPTEEQLAATFRVAPMTLRQALAQLRALGYVETRRGRNGGTYVLEDIAERLEQASLSSTVLASDLRDLTDWRRAVSGEASALAAVRSTPAELEELDRRSCEYTRHYQRPADRRIADAQLHLHIAQLSRSTRLLEAERDIQDTLSRILRVVPDAQAGMEAKSTHDGLIDAIASGDSTRARFELHEHVELTFTWSLQQPNVIDDRTDTLPL